MLEAFTPSHRRLTIILLAAGGAFVVAAAMVGIADNPAGVLLVYLGSAAGVTALVHPWRTPRQYRYLAYASILVLGLCAVLHGVFDALGRHNTGGLSAHVLQPVGVAAFVIAAFLCPAGFLVGVFGALIAFVRRRRHPPESAAAAGVHQLGDMHD